MTFISYSPALVKLVGVQVKPVVMSLVSELVLTVSFMPVVSSLSPTL